MSALDDVIKFVQKHESFVGPGVYLSDKAAAELAALRARNKELEDARETIIDSRDLARTRLPIAGFTEEEWANHRTNRIAGILSAWLDRHPALKDTK